MSHPDYIINNCYQLSIRVLTSYTTSRDLELLAVSLDRSYEAVFGTVVETMVWGNNNAQRMYAGVPMRTMNAEMIFAGKYSLDRNCCLVALLMRQLALRSEVNMP